MQGSDLEEGSSASLLQTGNTNDAKSIESPSISNIVKAIRSFKQDFQTEMDSELSAIKNIQTNIKECSGRITEAE